MSYLSSKINMDYGCSLFWNMYVETMQNPLYHYYYYYYSALEPLFQ